jgi:cytochrome P450
MAQSTEAPDDLLTLIAGAKDEQGEFISEADVLSLLMQLLVGGNETTTSLITNMIWRLLQAPQQWHAVKHNASLIEAAIEESLRFDPPVLGLYRNTTRDVNLHDVTIPANSKVYINYAAANRDPSVFPQPDSFDLQRERKRHMSFGLGVHFCLGAPMALMEAEIALQALIERLPDLKLLGPGERIAPFFLWGRRKLPVAWR